MSTALATAIIPAASSLVGGLFKGNETKYTNQMTSQQQYYYDMLMKMLSQKMGQPAAGYQPTSNAINLLYKTFLPGVTSTSSTTSKR